MGLSVGGSKRGIMQEMNVVPLIRARRGCRPGRGRWFAELNQQPAQWETLREQLRDVFKFRADRVAFVRNDGFIEFQVVAKVIDDMRAAGISSVGLC